MITSELLKKKFVSILGKNIDKLLAMLKNE